MLGRAPIGRCQVHMADWQRPVLMKSWKNFLKRRPDLAAFNIMRWTLPWVVRVR